MANRLKKEEITACERFYAANIQLVSCFYLIMLTTVTACHLAKEIMVDICELVIKRTWPRQDFAQR